jgi:dephospho-CoA kinase
MRVIGITGGIGSGKSTVASFLAELGAVVIDADKTGHELLRSDTPVRREVIAAFGEQILDANGEIDRHKLGDIVFDNPEARLRLNRIMHPRMKQQVAEQIKTYAAKGASVVVIEAPLLIEAGWASVVDEVWVTTASEATIMRRLQKRSGLSASESTARLRSQLPAADRMKHADVIIDTDCSLDELEAKVKTQWQKLHQ